MSPGAGSQGEAPPAPEPLDEAATLLAGVPLETVDIPPAPPIPPELPATAPELPLLELAVMLPEPPPVPVAVLPFVPDEAPAPELSSAVEPWAQAIASMPDASTPSARMHRVTSIAVLAEIGLG